MLDASRRTESKIIVLHFSILGHESLYLFHVVVLSRNQSNIRERWRAAAEWSRWCGTSHTALYWMKFGIGKSQPPSRKTIITQQQHDKQVFGIAESRVFAQTQKRVQPTHFHLLVHLSIQSLCIQKQASRWCISWHCAWASCRRHFILVTPFPTLAHVLFAEGSEHHQPILLLVLVSTTNRTRPKRR